MASDHYIIIGVSNKRYAQLSKLAAAKNCTIAVFVRKVLQANPTTRFSIHAHWSPEKRKRWNAYYKEYSKKWRKKNPKRFSDYHKAYRAFRKKDKK